MSKLTEKDVEAIGKFLVVVFCLALFLAISFYGGIFLGLGSIAVLEVAFLVNFFRSMWECLFATDGWDDQQAGPEPAFRQYFFSKAFRDCVLVVRTATKMDRGTCEWFFKGAGKMFASVRGESASWEERDNSFGAQAMGFMGRALQFALTAAMFLAGGIAILGGGIMYVMLTAYLLAAIVICSSAVFLTAVVVLALERVRMLFGKTSFTCPKCGHGAALPVYVCECGARHRRLLPGLYGVFHRFCECERRLPTLALLGRDTLPVLCPRQECALAEHSLSTSA